MVSIPVTTLPIYNNNVTLESRAAAWLFWHECSTQEKAKEFTVVMAIEMAELLTKTKRVYEYAKNIVDRCQVLLFQCSLLTQLHNG